MFTYLKDREDYEQRFDEATVELCRSGEKLVNETFNKAIEKIPKKEFEDKVPGWYLEYSQYYFMFVEVVAANRAIFRDMQIEKWQEEDKQKDERLKNATVDTETFCRKCGKNMTVFDKNYMHRDGHNDDDILIMLECESCKERIAFWQDGTEWEGADIKCEKCGEKAILDHIEEPTKIIWKETCATCGHVKTDIMDLTEYKDKPDPVDKNLAVDLKRFTFDEKQLSRFQEKYKHLQRLATLFGVAQDKTDNADVFDAIKHIKKLKIAQLKTHLEPIFTKHHYSDFKLGDPQVGREVSLDFNCLDTKDDRDEYDSKKSLRKAIENELIETNWRLMSDGVNYRLGFLSGRLRAYESEEELRKLVEQRIKSGSLDLSKLEKQESKKPKKRIELDPRDAIQTYFGKLYLENVPAEITLKSGKIKQTGIPTLRGELLPSLRVLIPIRENDHTFPDFIRNFNFTISNKDKIPKVHKDKLGRTIRRT